MSIEQDRVQASAGIILDNVGQSGVQNFQSEVGILFNAYPDAVLVVSALGQIVHANRQVNKVFGYTPSELVGKQVGCLIPEPLRQIHRPHCVRFQENPHMRPMGVGQDLYALRKDGVQFPVDIQLSPIDSGNGIWTVAVVRDITDRKAFQAALDVEMERGRVTLNSIGDAVLSTDVAGNVVYLNKVAEHLTGWTRQEALHRPLAEVFQTIDGYTRAATPDPSIWAIQTNAVGSLPINSILVRRDGHETPIEDSVAPIHDAAEHVVGSVIVFHDVSQTRHLIAQMIHLAQYDHLTDLPNRMLLSDRISQSIILADRHSMRLAVLFLDLDRFKHINDSFGHTIGDQLLQSVSTRLLACVREADTVSRTGGDEFVILLSEITDSLDAAFNAEKMLAALAAPHIIVGHTLQISVSIGISVFPDDGRDAETLIKSADMAMYHAKKSGRNNHQFFSQEMNLRSIDKHSLEADLHGALERHEFVLHYQPKVDLETGKVMGCEALIRWQHPRRGLLPPAQFVLMAEDSGLIVLIGRWVLCEACRQLQAWQRAGLQPVTVAVNVSALEFRDRSFLDNVRAVLVESGLEPRYLELELTESVLMQNAESATAMLKKLKALGVQLAVDDFGTGYSNLSYLSNFPIDVLKIDQAFVREITTGSNSAIVSAVIGLCAGLKCRVIAEGVESREQAEVLHALHCTEAQGSFFHQPMVAEEFAKLLATSRH